jgi:hypothetical protein
MIWIRFSILWIRFKIPLLKSKEVTTKVAVKGVARVKEVIKAPLAFIASKR